MKLTQAKLLLTGAAGGLGQALARQLAAKGARLLLVDRDGVGLRALSDAIGTGHAILETDLLTETGIMETLHAASDFGANGIINNAGLSSFGMFESERWLSIQRILMLNLSVPMRLTHALLPQLAEHPEAIIVNLGSAFGNVPFPGFTAYSSTKSGLRAFSQGLRRELADTRVAVVHVTPRAIQTALNTPEVNALNRALGNRSDTPEFVANKIVHAMANHLPEVNPGFPERLFGWLNSLCPRLIDQALKPKLPLIRQHCSSPLPTTTKETP